MFILNDEEILKQTTLEKYTKGKELFGKKLFSRDDIHTEIQPTDSSIINYRASFMDDNKKIEAFIRIHDTYGILYYDCDCNRFESFYQGMCPHLVALALTIASINKSAPIKISSQKKIENLALEHKKTEITKDQLIIESIVSQYNDIQGTHVSNVQLIPLIDTKNMTISLKIGTDYLYTIFDINLLLTSILDQEERKYGQRLNFVHEKKAFNDEGRALVDLLLKITPRSSTPIHHLPITPFALESIIDIFREKEISIDGKNVYLSNEDYSLSIKLTKHNSLELSISTFQIINGYNNDFIIIDKRLYNLNTIDKALFPLIEYLKGHKKITFGNTLDLFLEKLYPIIYDKIDVPEDFKENHPIIKLIIDSYIDYDNGVITIEPAYEMLNLKLENAIYDKKKEQAYYDEIKDLGFYHKDSKYIIDTAEGITKFLSCNLEGLKSYGALFISENLKKININQIKPRINITYDVDMMSVCFEDLSFTNDELYEIYRAYSKQKRYVILNDNRIISINDEFHDTYRLIKDLNLDPKNLKQNQKVPLYLAMKTQNNSNINYSNEIKTMFDEIRSYQSIDYPLIGNFGEILRSYQIDGFKWLKTLGKYGFGGILADDMGLGKTIQIITLLASDTVDKPSLIICPTSLTYNWKNEIEKWAPNLSNTIISGPANTRFQAISSIQNNKAIYITSYDSLRRDIEFYQQKFRFVIIDEAQYIKNYFTQKAQAVKSISGELKYALTGTPIENSLLDLWSIFDFLMPNYLGTYNDFRTKYTASIEDESLGTLAKKIQPFILRRTKKDVLKDLPDKFEVIRVAQMETEQRKVYEAFLLKTREALSNTDNRISILSMLTRLRQLCVDPKLYLDNYLGKSCKVELCLEIIEEAIHENHRILLFSQFKSLFPIIESRLREKNIIFLELTGDTPSKERLSLVNSFNSDNNIKVFLISLKAGGTGLNLTGADMVIHFDPWWNVSTENQATDRAHRIGQTKIVQVNKLICEDSIEQKVIELQNIKKELADRVITDEEISKLSDNDIRFLLS